MAKIAVTYRPDIDGLRAVAVLSVVGFHAFPDAVPGGYVGVDVFFVISGFLISSMILTGLERGTFSFGEFYARRVRRIFPALVVVLLACFAMAWALLSPHEYRELGKHITAGAGFLSNFALMRDSGYFAEDGTKPLLHLWSLGIEEQFYVVWPLLLWLCRGRALIVGILVASFLLNVALIHGHPIGTFYSPLTRAWELMVGAVLATLPVRRSELRSWGGLVLIVAALFVLDRDSAFPGWWALLPTVGAALLISSPGAAVNRALSHPAAVWIGLISYPLYLWHWPLLAFGKVYGLLHGHETTWAAVILSVVLAWATYRLVELPIRGGRHKLTVAGLVASMVIAGGVGLLAYAQGGFESRFPEEIQALIRFESGYDKETEYRSGSCFLSPEQTAFGPCVDDGARVFLWGDSYAASLYPGLRAEGVKLAQFTSSGCPPIIGQTVTARRNCKAVNDVVFEELQRLRPDTVILGAAWHVFGAKRGAEVWDQLDVLALRETIERIYASGVRRVVVVGNLPVWKMSQPRVIATQYYSHNRSAFLLDPEAVRADARIRAAVRSTKAEFISPIDLLCNDEGCLLFVSGSPVSFDTGHLTREGSQYLASRLVDQRRAALVTAP